MPDEQETNQEVVEQPNPEGEPIVNPEAGNEEPTGQEAEATPTESPELTPERIQELVQLEAQVKEANITDFGGLMRDYTQKSQAVPEMQRERDHALSIARKALGERDAAVDPIEAKRQAWVEAQQSYEPERIAATFDDYQSALFKRERAETLQQSNKVQEMRASYEEGKQFGDYTTDQLGETYQKITPKHLALLRRYDEGDLGDVLNADVERRKVEAEKKARMNQMFGQASGGQIPGSFEANPVPTIEWVDFVLMPESDRADLKERGIRILNSPDD